MAVGARELARGGFPGACSGRDRRVPPTVPAKLMPRNERESHRRIFSFLSLIVVVAGEFAAACAGAPPLPRLPYTVGMTGPNVDLIESEIAAFDCGDLHGARTDSHSASAGHIAIESGALLSAVLEKAARHFTTFF
jgi:hypothetical protein